MTTEEFKIELLPVKNKLFNLGIRLLNNRQEAEDVVQEVYLKLWKMRDKLNQYKSTEALMVTMTRNLCLDKLKSKSNKFSSLTFELANKSACDPEQYVESSDLLKKVMKVISKLPEQQRTIVHLRDIEGYDYNEIVEMTGLELNYIRVNLSRARKKIRETIQKIQYYEIEK
jgi:RNA polymerase sigma-70 factor (ECF subfamily)